MRSPGMIISISSTSQMELDVSIKRTWFGEVYSLHGMVSASSTAPLVTLFHSSRTPLAPGWVPCCKLCRSLSKRLFLNPNWEFLLWTSSTIWASLIQPDFDINIHEMEAILFAFQERGHLWVKRKSFGIFALESDLWRALGSRWGPFS
jgi:hypothetical protein